MKLMTRKLLVGPVVGAMLSAVIISGCAVGTGLRDGRDSEHATESRGISEREGGDSGGEHSSKRESNESNGEHGSRGEGGSTGSDGGGEAGEAAMSSPIIPLAQSWNGVLGGLAVSMQYDAATWSIHGTVRNTLAEKTLLRTGRAPPEVWKRRQSESLAPISWDT